jgi:hypothetical protein
MGAGTRPVHRVLKPNPGEADAFDMTSEEEEFKSRMIELYARQGAKCAICEVWLRPLPDFDGAFDRPFSDSARLLCPDCSEFDLSLLTA